MRYLVCFAFFAAVSLPADLSLAQDVAVYGARPPSLLAAFT